MAAYHTTLDPVANNSADADAALLARLAAFSRLMDDAFEIPGLKVRFGLDAILGIIPGVGDVLSNVLSAYLVVEAQRLGVTKWDTARMVGNILVDAAISSVPIAGDIFDVFWRANDKNMAILHAHLRKRGRIIDGVAVRLHDELK